uniref:Cadherin domain-containing protein n=3 Tax=Wuchereria bancrofti TaxID=6293 RepID=A0A1I8EBB1_WUCBA
MPSKEFRLVIQLVLQILFGTILTSATSSHRHRVPIIDLGGADELVGTVREDRTIVNVIPKLGIVHETGPVCRYELTSENSDDVPFIVDVNDEKEGSGIVRVKDGVHLDCSNSQYHLTVVAIRCDDDAKSESARLRISVKDTNNHVPVFSRPWYTFNISEGKIYSELARLQATDKDCGHPYGQICRYQITNALDGFPFAIDDQGVLRNTRPLNYTQAKSYILTIVAHDCGMRQSKSTLVTINVHEACIDGIHGIPEQVTYISGSGSVQIAPNAHIVTCAEEQSCTLESVKSVVTLQTDNLTNGCDRDDFIPKAVQNKCGMDESTIALLTATGDSVTDNSVTDDKYAFDGKSTSVIVSQEKVDDVIPLKFTLTFSMKHARGSIEEQALKQTILCESDYTNMNRHHFAVYTRHCKLEMLMRRESNAEAAFRAAEWRWSIPEVCDNHWHSYSILFASVDTVDLYIDGRKFIATKENPEILDDWPLHRIKETKTRLVIGACWHGRSRIMSQFFKGHLASIYYLPHKIEQPQVLQCSHQCKEKLEFNAIDQLMPGENAIFATDSSSFSLKANTAEDLSLLLQRVTYGNTKNLPTPGHRTFFINTTVQCSDGKMLILNPSKGTIFVQHEAEPVISISGLSVVNSDQHLVKTGAPMLPEIKITVTQNINGEEIERTSVSELDWCKVHLKPSRDMDLEYFSSPASLIAALRIDFEHDKQGILLKGKEKVKGYREILSKIHYFNTRADSYSRRIYTVQCAMNGGHILSNEFLVTMNINTSLQSSEIPITEILDDDEEIQVDPAFDRIGGNRLQNLLEMDLPRPKALMSHHGYGVQGAIAGGAVAVVIVLCVGFLLVMLVIGVLKIRDTPIPSRRRRNRRNTEGGMEWDDSGMNITVNPLEEVDKNSANFSDEESSDGAESFHDEGLTEDEDAGHVLPHVDNEQQNRSLEWDDTTLTNISRTYRV